MKQEVNFSAINFSSSSEFISVRKVWWFIPLAIVLSVGGIFIGTMYGFAAALFVGSYIFGKQLAEGRKKVLSKFAVDNGWNFKQEVYAEDIPLGVRFMGRSQDAYDVIEGHYNGVNFTLFEYKYVVGSGKSTRTVVSTVMKLTTSIQSPYILLDSRNNMGGARETLKTAEKLELEGDFHKNFLMYVEPKNRVDALSIISPDVMQTVMHSNKSYDIEIYGNSLFLYVEGDRRNRTYIRDLFGGVDAIMKEINHRAKTFKSSNDLTVVSKDNMKSLSELYVNLSIGGRTTSFKAVRFVIIIALIFMFITISVNVFKVFSEFNTLNNTVEQYDSRVGQ